MTLSQLLYDIRKMYSEVSSMLTPYMEIPEVESFIERRGKDLKEFERVVSGYKLTELTGIVLNSLRERGAQPKIYGICQRGEEYFTITKKVQKAIAEYENQLFQEAYNQDQNKTQTNFDINYDIFDELEPEEYAEHFDELE